MKWSDGKFIEKQIGSELVLTIRSLRFFTGRTPPHRCQDEENVSQGAVQQSKRRSLQSLVNSGWGARNTWTTFALKVAERDGELVPSTMPQEVLFSSNLTLKSPGPHPAFCCTYVCNERCSGICFSRHRVYVPGGPSTPFTSKPQSCSSPGFSEAEPCLQAHSYICSGCSPEAIAQLGTALPTWSPFSLACRSVLIPNCTLGLGAPQEQMSIIAQLLVGWLGSLWWPPGGLAPAHTFIH